MSRRSITRRPHARLAFAVAVAVALAVAGCGATPPQAPFAQAKKLDSATGDISTDCGLSYQVTAFPGDHRADIANLDASAASSARKLASVYARNPAWIYQGDTVRQIVDDGFVMLRTCGLNGAARVLRTLVPVRPRVRAGSG
jgi:hypothetical protein